MSAGEQTLSDFGHFCAFGGTGGAYRANIPWHDDCYGMDRWRG